MTFESILALTDFTTPAEHALDRAAMLAVRHRSKLRILYATEVPSLAFSDPFARLQQRARQLARRHGIAAEALAHSGDMMDAIVRHAAHSDLLVLDHRQHRQWRAFWRGTTLDQLVRRCPCPVLVVRQAPSGAYGPLLVAVDLTSDSKGLFRYTSGVEEKSEFEFFHALNTFSDPGIFSDAGAADGLEVFRQVILKAAQGRLIPFYDSFDLRRSRASCAAGRAESASPIPVQQKVMRSGLVIVGTRRNSTLVDFLFGSVARRVVSLAGCDVLVVCHDYKARSGAAAKRRMQSLLNDDASQLQLVRRRLA